MRSISHQSHPLDKKTIKNSHFPLDLIFLHSYFLFHFQFQIPPKLHAKPCEHLIFKKHKKKIQKRLTNGSYNGYAQCQVFHHLHIMQQPLQAHQTWSPHLLAKPSKKHHHHHHITHWNRHRRSHFLHPFNRQPGLCRPTTGWNSRRRPPWHSPFDPCFGCYTTYCSQPLTRLTEWRALKGWSSSSG